MYSLNIDYSLVKLVKYLLCIHRLIDEVRIEFSKALSSSKSITLVRQLLVSQKVQSTLPPKQWYLQLIIEPYLRYLEHKVLFQQDYETLVQSL